MQKIFIVLFFSLSLFGASLNWSSNYDAALKEAAKEDKLVYIFITSDNCKWCKKFAQTTLQDSGVKNRLKKEFVAVHMSRDQVQIPSQFETTPVPRHYFVNAKGEILYSSLGHRDVSSFLAFIDFAKDEEQLKKEKK